MTVKRAAPRNPAPRSDSPGQEDRPAGLGGSLLRAWLGYRRRLDAQLAAAGFDDRRLPDGRVLRICARSAVTTISQIGRELEITRQGAGKIVASLRERGYVTVAASPTDGREKIVNITSRAKEYLAAHRKAARHIERQLHDELGPDGFQSLYRLLAALGADDLPHASDYLRLTTDVSAFVIPET